MFDTIFVIAFATASVIIAAVLALIVVLLTVGATALPPMLRGIQRGDYVSRRRQPQLRATADPDPAWPDDDVALVSLAEMARQRSPDRRPPTLPAGTETHLSADGLVLEMLHTLAADYQHTPQVHLGL